MFSLGLHSLSQTCILALSKYKRQGKETQNVMSEPRKQPKLELDLKTAFLPSWAQKSSKANPYSKHKDREPPSPPRRKDSRHSNLQEKPRTKAKEQRGNDSPREDKQPRPQSRSADSRNQKADRESEGKPNRPFAGNVGQSPHKTQPKWRTREEVEKILASLPNLNLSILPDPKRVKSLGDKIRQQCRAYSLFDIARLVLERPDRFKISATILQKGPGKPVSEQWLCLLDDTLWLSQEAAVQHTIRRNFDKFYERVRTKIDPPKGNFAFVAQCGISGKILGPPNYHGYQKTLQDLHAEQFSKMSFQAYKDRVKIVRDEEVVQKWLDDQSWKTEYKAKTDASVLASMEEVPAHFKAHHLKETLKAGETLQLSATAGLQNPDKPVRKLIQFYLEEQQRFPLESASILGRMFSQQGLHVFRFARNGSDRPLLYISVARPRCLSENEVLSKEIQRIMDFVRANPDCTRKKLIESLRPQTDSNPAALQSPSAEEASAPAGSMRLNPKPPVINQWTPEEKAIIADLHWLIHEGNLIEFSDGKIEAAKKPPPGEKSHRSASDRTAKGKRPHSGSSKTGGKPGKSRRRKQTKSTPAKS